MRALLSVYDKAGIAEFAQALLGLGADLVSTGGTSRVLQEAGLTVQQVSEMTRFPEILGGRVKTLHPVVYGGILARPGIPEHMAELSQHAIQPIDVVAVNLYPFESTSSKPGVEPEEVLENIDIGGPSMLRAAAKNYPHVVVIADPADYEWVAERLSNRSLSLSERRGLAAKAFQHVAFYDTLVTEWLRGAERTLFPVELTFALRKQADMRYGENPHQQGALYTNVPTTGGIIRADQLNGKELSFNNIADADVAWSAVCCFVEPTVVVVKHANPCGLASHPDQVEAYRRAHSCDSTSAYGGIVGFNSPLTAETAEAMSSVFYEVVVAPAYEPGALAILRKKRGLRILKVPEAHGSSKEVFEMRQVSGGVLLQTSDCWDREILSTWEVATRRKPTDFELADLAFAWNAARWVKSNAIVLARDKVIIGVGAGQPNRLTSVHLALRTAGERASGSVLASDAFFPFADGLELAVQAGITAVVQPGGSIRDGEVVATADQYGVAMLFTNMRHFRH
jgi:phosphoribosylaminoimidazolecarboxamide formyltransferase/IMP cyclohydrolase